MLRASRFACRPALLTTHAALIVVGAMVALVASGPIEFAAVRDRVESALAARLGGDYDVKVGRSTIDVATLEHVVSPLLAER